MNDSFGDKPLDPWLLVDSQTQVIDVKNDNDMKFNDNFEPQSDASDDCLKRLQSIDSQQYLRSLEKKLEKLKGKAKEMSTKDVINSLAIKRDAIVEQLLHASDCTQLEFDSNNLNNSSLYHYVERRLFPQTQAITEEELHRLLDADLLQKITAKDGEGVPQPTQSDAKS